MFLNLVLSIFYLHNIFKLLSFKFQYVSFWILHIVYNNIMIYCISELFSWAYQIKVSISVLQISKDSVTLVWSWPQEVSHCNSINQLKLE